MPTIEELISWLSCPDDRRRASALFCLGSFGAGALWALELIAHTIEEVDANDLHLPHERASLIRFGVMSTGRICVAALKSGAASLETLAAIERLRKLAGAKNPRIAVYARYWLGRIDAARE